MQAKASSKMKGKLEGIGKEFLDGVKCFAIAAFVVVAAIFCITRFLVMVAFIPSGSMEPTIPTGSIMLCLRTDYWAKDPMRGDVVVFRRDNSEDGKVYTKRVVGLPGDVVEIIEGKTYINGEYYDETAWLAEEPDPTISCGPYTVPEGQYFFMGDNRNYSIDGRGWPEHFVSRENIFARGHLVIDASELELYTLDYEK